MRRLPVIFAQCLAGELCVDGKCLCGGLELDRSGKGTLMCTPEGLNLCGDEICVAGERCDWMPTTEGRQSFAYIKEPMPWAPINRMRLTCFCGKNTGCGPGGSCVEGRCTCGGVTCQDEEVCIGGRCRDSDYWNIRRVFKEDEDDRRAELLAKGTRSLYNNRGLCKEEQCPCAETSCTYGEQCLEGQCVCGHSLCLGETQCRPVLVPCTCGGDIVGWACKCGDVFCNGGGCKNEHCVCGTQECRPGETCVEGACACGPLGERCVEGEICEHGECRCGRHRACGEGRCVDERCMCGDKLCEKGEFCKDGQCECAGGNRCGAGELCYKHEMEDDGDYHCICGAKSVKLSFYKDWYQAHWAAFMPLGCGETGRCDNESLCVCNNSDKACVLGSSCVNGKCDCAGKQCNEHEICYEGECVCGIDYDITALVCGDGGQCAAPEQCRCGRKLCRPFETCVGGRCDCGGVQCSPFESCNIEGNCVIGLSNDNIIGYSCREGGKAVSETQCQCSGTLCEPGQECSDGMCN
ncbi:MAG: hypothetical protein WC966_02715 [Bradymonadales bacterium]|jgi:hypothetical protein